LPDGSILAGGNNGTAGFVMRLHQDGSIDESFGVGGIATLSDGAVINVKTLKADAAKRILVGAEYPASEAACVLRLGADGSPELFFNAQKTPGRALTKLAGVGVLVLGATFDSQDRAFFAVRSKATGTDGITAL